MALRACNIKDDTDIMISLITDSFHYPENEGWNLSTEEITGVVDDFRTMRTLYPIFKLGGLFNPTLNAILRGYIWEEEGQPVGLVNLSPRGLDNQTWVIGNVAVLPDYRRKGIARQLVQATIDLTRLYHIKHVILEVIADNLPAVKLYENMGFEIYSQHVQLQWESKLPARVALPHGYEVMPYQASDWQAYYQLMKSITPQSVQNYEPLSERQFQKPFMLRVLRSLILLLAPMKSMAYLIRHQSTGEVVARFVTYPRKKAGGMNEITIDLAPEHAILAPYIVSRCVHDCQHVSPGREIELRIANWQPAVIQSALDAGFVTRAEWYMMGMHLR